MAATSAIAQVIGDVWLDAHKRPSFKGSLTVTSYGGVRTSNGAAPLHPSLLLLNAGQLIRLNNRIDPATGGVGRDAVIASVTYNYDSGQATLQLDNERDKLAALLARYGIALSTGTG
jgi:hypothetical protein